MALELNRHQIPLTRKQVRNLMYQMKIRAIRPKKNTSVKHPEHPIYPYLLRGLQIRHPNQVRCTDITHIKLPEIGFVYLIAILDIYSRKVLSWRISNSMDAGFCEESLKDALERFGTPAIFNTDQGSQFTSYGFIQILTDHHIRISMDGQGRWADNMYIERLWNTVTYEDQFPQAITCLEDGLEDSLQFYRFEKIDQRKIASTNTIERLNREIRRQSKVVGIFPNMESYIRLITSYLMEYEEDWQSGKAYISVQPPAEQQQILLEAA